MNQRHTQLRDALGRLKQGEQGMPHDYGQYCECPECTDEDTCPDCLYSPCSCPDERTNEPERGPIFSF